MDKNAIKKYAVWARRELIARVSQKALQYGITETDSGDPNADSINGTLLSNAEKKQRKALISQINEKGYEQVMEEVAYTWFNRYSALRFMEVNGYLPSHVRVFTDENNNFKPQIITEAIHLELDGLDMEKVYALKDENKTDELYKYLLITQCNALSSILPGMFQKIEDYTELLFPDNLLRDGSVVQQMIELIPEEDWKDAVQIIGWLYQYYNTEPKAEVFGRKSGTRIKKEEVPAATQLFTPEWIVRYMVENSLGRLWVEGHPNDELKAGWKYYLDEAEQELEVEGQLAKIRKEYEVLKPEDIKCIDPCSGSGHILAYLFDVLMQIYEVYGYTTREAVASIVENNLYGLDIDDRAAQLANFAVMMKARQYDRRFFSHVVQPKVYAINESNHIDNYTIDYFANGDMKLEKVIKTIVSEMHDAKEYGSVLKITPQDWSSIHKRFDEVESDINMYRDVVLNDLLPIVRDAEVLSQKYNVVATNPPYMAMGNADANMNKYVKQHFSDSKADLYSVFIDQCGRMTKPNYFIAMITQQSWMFLSTYEKLRIKMVGTSTISMAHLGARAFEEIGGEVVQTTSFVRRNAGMKKYKACYARLIEATSQDSKEELFLKHSNLYYAAQEDFSQIPGSPIAYWVSQNVFNAFTKYPSLSSVCDVKNGMSTTDNNKFTRIWHECEFDNIAFGCGNSSEAEATGKRWFPYNKGGEFRKWYGNMGVVVNWQYDGKEIKKAAEGASGGRIVSQDYYFRQSVSWSKVSSGAFALRMYPQGYLFDVAGPGIFADKASQLYIMALLNSKLNIGFLKELYPTMNYEMGQISGFPILIDDDIKPKVVNLSQENYDLSVKDWNNFENSWDFKKHPLIQNVSTIKEAFENWETESTNMWKRVAENEEEINRIFISLYGLSDDITPEVDEKLICIRRAELTRDIKSLISYAVGCMFGRYSLDTSGLVFAGGKWDAGAYSSFQVDSDNIIPICEEEYFEDDIVGKFMNFIKVVYGEQHFEDNLNFIAMALGGNGRSREIIRNYFVNEFFSNHCSIYSLGILGKRPIYWLFDSGKKGGFKALIYMHRYQQDTIARMRTDYVHEQQARYRTEIEDLETRIASASTSEKVKMNKQLSTLNDKATEIRQYEEKIHHLADQMIRIDLDDGVKNNYAIFQDVLAKIK